MSYNFIKWILVKLLNMMLLVYEETFGLYIFTGYSFFMQHMARCFYKKKTGILLCQNIAFRIEI